MYYPRNCVALPASMDSLDLPSGLLGSSGECVHVPIDLEESQVLDQQDLDQKLESIPADEVFRWKGRAPFRYDDGDSCFVSPTIWPNGAAKLDNMRTTLRLQLREWFECVRTADSGRKYQQAEQCLKAVGLLHLVQPIQAGTGNNIHLDVKLLLSGIRRMGEPEVRLSLTKAMSALRSCCETDIDEDSDADTESPPKFRRLSHSGAAVDAIDLD